jgi:hypothetical protein
MKKNIALFFSLLLLAGCITHKPIIWDETLAENGMTTIYWCGTGNYVHPVSYNGIAVDWKISSFGYNVIKIPGGITTFELGGYTTRVQKNAITGDGVITAWVYTGITFNYNFENGKEYSVYFQNDRMGIYSGKIKSPISKETLLREFIFDFN